MTTTEWKPDAESLGIKKLIDTARHRALITSLIIGVALSFLFYVAYFFLCQEAYQGSDVVPPLRLTTTLTFYRWPILGRIADAVTPDNIVFVSWQSQRAVFSVISYAAIAIGLMGAWLYALWAFRPGKGSLPLAWVLIPIGLFSLPLIWLPGLTSPDMYLYTFYGRIISTHSGNPFLLPPDAFPKDPHLNWVNWRSLPSAYGPLWLMISGGLSAIGGDGLWSNIFAYKMAMLAVHLITTVAIWLLLREIRPRMATWGAIFYGWNPFILTETVGNGHNDAAMTMFVLLCLLAATRKRWALAVFFLAAAAMVKLTAFILLPILLLAWIMSVPTVRQRIWAVLVTGAVTLGSSLLLYAPLWAGKAIITNIKQNPAATDYQNTLWQLLTLHFASQPNPTKADYYQQLAAYGSVTSHIDAIRVGLMAIAYLVLLYRFVFRNQGLVTTWVWVWFAYCATVAWIWPWYFIVAIALAAVCVPGRTTLLAMALSLGGLIFWMGWPEPALPAVPWLHDFRSSLLIGPALVVTTWILYRYWRRERHEQEAAAT